VTHLPVRSTLLLLLLGACGGSARQKPLTTQQERALDSTIGQSRLPGAAGVRGALRIADSAAARRNRLDSIAQQQE
jgi:hypothetical protein